MSPSKNNLRQSIRNEYRLKRRSLTPLVQKLNAIRLARNPALIKQIKQARNIAVYLSNDGEINLSILIKKLWNSGKNCYLPVLDKKRPGHLIFLPYIKGQNLVKNKYKISEPVYNYKASKLAKQLDIILMPLVSFDKHCNRIGMGGGYYDRSLNFLQQRHTIYPCKKPLLIGVAHSVQEDSNIPYEPWDIRPDMIVTNNNNYKAGVYIVD